MAKNPEKEILLYSGSFPLSEKGELPGQKPISNVHSLIKGISIDENLIQYKPITIEYKDEIKKLHKEWFPVNYEDSFFDNIFSCPDWYFTCGVFYPFSSASISSPQLCSSQEILVGMAICGFIYLDKYQKQLMEDISPEIMEEINNNINVEQEVKSFLKKYNYTCFYIYTVGVIDEFRGKKVATNLLECIMEYVAYYDSCMFGYLHVLSTNSGAIKCYEKNGFLHSKTMKDFYSIDDRKYDGELYVRVITKKEKDKIKNELKKNLPLYRKLFEQIIIKPFYYFLKILLVIFFLKCCSKKKIKTD